MKTLTNILKNLSRRSIAVKALAGLLLLSTSGVMAQSLPANNAGQPAAQPATPLSLEQAIQLAIETNLGTLIAKERQNEARGKSREALSSLLPNVSGTFTQENKTINLRALGLNFGGLGLPVNIPNLVGPFDTFDARIHFTQTILDLSALRNYQAERAGIDIAKSQTQLAREQVATAAILAYVEAQRSKQAVAAAQSNLELAQTLQKLAEDQHTAGVATGVDVARAATQVSQNLFNLAQARKDLAQAMLQLQRVVGLPQGGDMVLTDSLEFGKETPLSPTEAVAAAQANRYELKIIQQQVRQHELQRKSAVAEQYPSLSFGYDYGVSGVTPANTALPTRSVGVQVNVPIFNGGATRARIAIAKSQKSQTELELNDAQKQVEEDVRLALVTLTTTADQVRSAQTTLDLAQIELRLARDRFSAGVADNIEVVNAQTALQNARNTVVAALAAYNTARANLAAALGRAEGFRL